MPEGGGITWCNRCSSGIVKDIFNSVSEKEAIDPKEVERRLRDN